MKKLYIEPDFKLINIRLIEDELTTSFDVEETLPTAGGSDGEFDEDF